MTMTLNVYFRPYKGKTGNTGRTSSIAETAVQSGRDSKGRQTVGTKKEKGNRQGTSKAQRFDVSAASYDYLLTAKKGI